MTVKLNRMGYLFKPSGYARYLFWLVLYAYVVYNVLTDPDRSAVELIPITIVILAVEAFFSLYLAVTSFQVKEGEIVYYDKIDVIPGNGSKYEKMGFRVKGITSIEIKQNFFEKLFGFAHIEVVGEAKAVSGFDKYRLPRRNKHCFYGVRNAEDVYADMLAYFPAGVVENKISWR